MEEEASPSLMGRFFWFLGSCLLVIVLYAASVGPVIYFLPMGHGERYPVLEAFYAPLVWAVQHSSGLQRPMNAYAGWWAERKGQ